MKLAEIGRGHRVQVGHPLGIIVVGIEGVCDGESELAELERVGQRMGTSLRRVLEEELAQAPLVKDGVAADLIETAPMRMRLLEQPTHELKAGEELRSDPSVPVIEGVDPVFERGEGVGAAGAGAKATEHHLQALVVRFGQIGSESDRCEMGVLRVGFQRLASLGWQAGAGIIGQDGQRGRKCDILV